MPDIVICFFLLGLAARVCGSSLRLPQPLYEALGLYLLLAIGLKGGAELAHQPLAMLWPQVIGCAALYAFPKEGVGELAALAVDPDFRREGYGEALMREIEARARKLKLGALFVLTTRTSGWFLERGYKLVAISDLPQEKRALYNYQRKSLVYRKEL